MVKLKRFDVCLLRFDPTVGVEIKKTRPAVVISPDVMNLSRLNTLIIAPLISTIRPDFPTRVCTIFQAKQGQVALDQLRAVDRIRVIKKLGRLDANASKEILDVLSIMFQA